MDDSNLELSHFRSDKVRRLGVEKLIAWLHREQLVGTYSKVLDYGCGEFDVGQSIQNVVGRVDGFDIRKEAILRCRRRNSHSSSVFFDNEEDIPIKLYDLILLNGVVQYMESEQVFSDFLKKARSWISDDSNAMTILTCIIEENYSPVRDALSWLKEAFKKKAFVAMFFHVVIGGWYTIISKQNPTLVLSKEKVEKLGGKVISIK